MADATENNTKNKLGWARVFRIKNEEIRLLIPPILISIVLFVIGQLINPGFADIKNIGSILAIAGILAIGSSGQTLVIISGDYNIDLSIGAMMSMGAVLGSGLLNNLNSNIALAFLVMIGIGALFGFISGAGVWWMKIPALVMTLAMASVVDGFTLAVSKGRPFGGPAPALLWVGGARVFGWLRILVILTILLVVLFQYVLTRTRYGKKLLLIGNNRVAAQANGLNIGFIVIVTFIISGVMGSVAGIFLLSAVSTAQMQMGAPYTMLSVAAVVLGGTQLSGGKGSYIGTAIGSVVFVTLTNVLISIGMQPGVRLIITGMVLVAILAAYSRQPKLRQ